MRPALGKNDKGEVKGSKNGPEQIARVIKLLLQHQVLFEATVIDVGASTANAVTDKRNAYASHLDREIVAAGDPQQKAFFTQLRDGVLTFKDQSFLQAIATMDLLDRVLELHTAYYSQRKPTELGHFSWRHDPKEPVGTIPWEEWWMKFLLPWIHVESTSAPRTEIACGDYSAFSKYQVDCRTWDPQMVKHLSTRLGIPEREVKLRATGVILDRVFEDFEFDGTTQPGLELIDILSNALRRMMRGDHPLLPLGLPKLMIARPRSSFEVLLLSYDRPKACSFEAAARHFSSGGRPLLTAATAAKWRRPGYDDFWQNRARLRAGTEMIVKAENS